MESKPNPHKLKHAVAGVTLIELMVTIAVLAVVLGIGVPSFRDLILQNRLTSAANELLSGIAATRSEAIKRNATRRFCFNTQDLKWDLRTPESTPTIFREGTLSSGIGVATANLGTTQAANLMCTDYRSDGLPYSKEGDLVTNGSFALTLGSTTKTVHIKTGSVYVK